MKSKIELKTIGGELLFEFEAEDNSVKKAVVEAVRLGKRLGAADLSDADLSDADLWNANLRNADLRNANLRNADLRNANLRNADLWNADLWNADLWNADLWNANLSDADLRNADLRNANLRSKHITELAHIPRELVQLASRDMLFVFSHLRAELPFLKEKLEKGKVNGSQYEGDCACLIGTLANADESLEKVCSAIPFYEKGLHNPGEHWFLQIEQGDTPKNSVWVRHAVELIDSVLKDKKNKGGF